MVEKPTPFTIESFYKFVEKGKLVGAKCKKCSTLIVPPRPMCPKCFSKDLDWKELPKQGKLLTFTVIHVSPEKFQQLTPYAVGIIELERGARLPGILKNTDLEKIKVGMDLVVTDEKEPIPKEWPQWPRYYFEPVT